MAKLKPSRLTTEPEPVTATSLTCDIENGDTDKALARVRTLSQTDFINVLRAVQTLEKALSSYAYSWQDSCYWGNGQPYPDEQKAKAKATSA